ATHEQVSEPGLSVVGHVLDPDRFGDGTFTVIWQSLSGVLVHHQAMVLDGSKYRIPRRMIKGFEPISVRGLRGRRTPPRRPDAAMNWMSLIASSRSLGKMSPMPARRTGSSAQKSFSQRLWARMPARHR